MVRMKGICRFRFAEPRQGVVAPILFAPIFISVYGRSSREPIIIYAFTYVPFIRTKQKTHPRGVRSRGADEGNKSEPFYRPELLKSSLFNIRLKINLCSRLLGLYVLANGVFIILTHLYYKSNQIKILGGIQNENN